MAVMAREDWTDARIDDFKETVNQRFDQVDQRFDRVDADIRELRSEMRNGFERIDRRFESMQRMMIIGFVTLFASIAASVIGAAAMG